jgi:hypothetical protein
LSLWISLYEPLILLAALAVCAGAFRGKFFASHRRIGWLAFVLVLSVAAVIERRGLALPALDDGTVFRNWAGTIGELKSVGLNDGIWLHWLGYGVILAPLLLWLGWKKESSRVPPAILVLLAVTFLLTIWQARWGYFFAAVFVLTIPAQIAGIRPRWLAGPVFILLLLPVLRDWDERLWPDESHLAARLQDRREHVEWRQAARSLGSDRTESFLAPWWLAPSAVYWSGQPAVAGSSHESLPGIADSARFFLATDDAIAREILMRRGVRTVLVGHADEVAENSAAILAVAIPRQPLCAVLDATPSQAPRFLVLTGQNEAGKIFRVDFTR